MQIYPTFANSVDPLISWLLQKPTDLDLQFAIKHANLYQQSRLSNLIGLQLEMGVASYFIQHGKG